MMYNEDIAAIPVKNLLAQNCLIAIWCTNAPSNIAAVKDLIFTQWGVEYVTTWYWMKVTTDLEPLCDFGTGCKKQPYERIILGKVGDVNVPKKQLVVSVPSALHSHKPPLLDLLSPYLKVRNPQTLELFARYLLPNTTSVGYEPLKWQHISLYDKKVTFFPVISSTLLSAGDPSSSPTAFAKLSIATTSCPAFTKSTTQWLPIAFGKTIIAKKNAPQETWQKVMLVLGPSQTISLDPSQSMTTFLGSLRTKWFTDN
ncbi:hypothetical protein MSG28_008782 [Choristoneura fumiferana]|uniref:Uncharacterized protein n=1 Tax=Choristoneura fumiferana TaxID=7141 RepID=A0ACC0J837_CHOFU|nr:hypothetical protein MSG28_008782 [Choristoneura fumiferana]